MIKMNLSIIKTALGLLVFSVFAFHALSREFMSLLSHTKGHHNNGTNCLPA